MRGRSAVWPAIGALLACFAAWGAGDEVTVEHRPDLGETRYSIAAEACRIWWTVYATELNRGVIHQRAACGLPLAEQVPLISKLLHRVIESDAEAARFRTLSWGRLYPDPPRDSTLAARLALAAKRSAQWDPVRGVSKTGDVNGFIRQLAQEASIYEELRPLFRASGLEIRLAAVEKVLVLPAGRLDFFATLRAAGVQTRDKVPFDCIAWFSITPAVPARR
jgi:hypothetical protein